MLILNPPTVAFGNRTWPNVRSVVVERAATREIVEWSDDGRFPTFADVPEQRVDVRVVQELAAEDVSSPIPGEAGTLVFHTAPGAADASRRTATAWCVVLSVKYDLAGAPSDFRAIRTPTREIRLTAVSTSGDTDPITVTEASQLPEGIPEGGGESS
jgi:hypothetical protein